jgi:hypothetical protein
MRICRRKIVRQSCALAALLLGAGPSVAAGEEIVLEARQWIVSMEPETLGGRAVGRNDRNARRRRTRSTLAGKSPSLKFTDGDHARELLELLYGVPPLYRLNQAEWKKRLGRIKAHYAFFSPSTSEQHFSPCPTSNG